VTRKISVIYKILTTLSLLIGIILNLIKTTSVISLLSYYTLQSNIVCFIAFLSFSIYELININSNYKRSDIYYLIKGSLVILIFVTTVCYHIWLSPLGFNMGPFEVDFEYRKIANVFVHTISPWLVIFDYFIFDEKENFKWFYPFLWLVFPLNYVIYVYIYVSYGGSFPAIGGSEHFPYFFLDYTQLGMIGVLKWIIGIVLLILIISYLLVFIDRKIFKKKKS